MGDLLLVPDANDLRLPALDEEPMMKMAVLCEACVHNIRLALGHVLWCFSKVPLKLEWLHENN